LYLLVRALYLNNCTRYFSLAPKLLDYRGEFFEEPLSRRYFTQDNALNECIKYGFSVNILRYTVSCVSGKNLGLG